jgi:hypothetical protein
MEGNFVVRAKSGSPCGTEMSFQFPKMEGNFVVGAESDTPTEVFSPSLKMEGGNFVVRANTDTPGGTEGEFEMLSGSAV